MNKIDLTGRSGIITGGARGIGYAIAERFLASGAKVALFDRDKAALEQAAAAFKKKGAVSTFAADVTDEGSLQKAFDGAAKEFGKVDIMVNNAGIAGPNLKTWEYPSKDFREVIEVDLIGVFLGCKIASAHMMKNKYGRIVNIASIAGKEGNPNASPYSAAKAGVIALTKSIGKELATSGVLVNCVTPAAAKTDIFKQITQQHIDYMLSKIPMNRFLMPQEAASLILWLASEDCAFSTGSVFDLSGGRATY